MLYSRAAALVLVLVTSVVMAGNQNAHGHDEVTIPLNLDYTRPGLVDAGTPWGWGFQSLRFSGIEVGPSPDRPGLRFSRQDVGPNGEALYDLNASFGGHSLRVVGSVHESEGVSTRIGLRVLQGDFSVAEAWSTQAGEGARVATIDVASDAQNVFVVIEYSGAGVAEISPLRMSVDEHAVLDGKLPLQSPPDEKVISWVREHAIPLATTALDDPLDDLAALDPVIGDARLVLVGESTHGTHEFFALRNRIIRALTDGHGFSIVAIEDNAQAAENINRYLATGQGSPAEATKGMFGVWARQETTEFIQALRVARVSAPATAAPVEFVGIDLQVPLGAFEVLDAFAAEYDEALIPLLEQNIKPMRAAWGEGWYPRRSPEEHAAWSAGAQRIVDYVNAHSEQYRVRIGGQETDRVLYNARLAWQSAEVSRSGDHRLRDRFMADNIAWLRAHLDPDARIIVWAHNTHIRRDEGAMGAHLAERFPEEVIAIGLATQRGEYTGYDSAEQRMKTYALFPGPVGSVEDLLARAGHPIFALDLRPARTAENAAWLRAPHRHRNIGLFAGDLGFYSASMTEGFDALIFVDRTTATRPIE